jgi:hypothetical protein
VDTADKSVKFFPHAFLYLKFAFLIRADHEIYYSRPYLVFKMVTLCKPAATIITGYQKWYLWPDQSSVVHKWLVWDTHTPLVTT